jgi:hypothetical protein
MYVSGHRNTASGMGRAEPGIEGLKDGDGDGDMERWRYGEWIMVPRGNEERSRDDNTD